MVEVNQGSNNKMTWKIAFRLVCMSCDITIQAFVVYIASIHC